MIYNDSLKELNVEEKKQMTWFLQSLSYNDFSGSLSSYNAYISYLSSTDFLKDM